VLEIMAEEKIIKAEKRDTKGTSEARRLRREGRIPGIVYGATGEPVSISLNRHTFGLMVRDFGHNFIGDLEIAGEATQKVLLKDIQYEPARGDILHADFVAVSMTETIQVSLPIEIVGEAAGVVAGGVLEQVLSEMEVECLPGNMVETIALDVSAMEIGDTLMVGDIQMPEGVKNISDVELAVVSIAAPRVSATKSEDEDAAAAAEGSETTES
jgi:large subunit ribosomal protein L25